MLKFLNLSPYNPGSQSKSRGISNQLDYNQDRIIQHNTSHVTFHKYLRRGLPHREVTNYYKPGLESSGTISYTHLVQVRLPVLQITFPQKH
jgi:hypothetical protein